MTHALYLPGLLLALLVSFGSHAQDDSPRQLNTLPQMPPPARPATTPPPLGNRPAARPDSAVVATPPPAPAPVYTPAPAGQLPGGNMPPPRYQVGLKNGLLYNANYVEVRTPLFSHSYLMLDGRQKIDFSEVGFYEDESGHYVRTTMPGTARETTFRRDRVGRISLYSITSTQYSSYGGGGMGMGYGGLPYGGYRTVKTEYFSKDNGPIQNLNNRNLVLATSDNSDAQQLLKRARSYQRGTIACYVVGGGLLVGGLLQTISPNANAPSISRLYFAAIPVLIIPIFLQSKQNDNQKQAIALYNSTR